MNRGALVLIVGLGVLIFSRASRASVRLPDSAIDPSADYLIEYSDMPETSSDVDNPDARVDAFLWMIGAAETSLDAMYSGDAYGTFYGFTKFSDFSDHPVITGEKVGVPLPDELCRRAGFKPGCVSTAAGFAQINVPTWRDVRRAGPWGDALTDFSPASQWEAARRVLIRSNAYDYVRAGDFENALRFASMRWASLKGSNSGQPQHSGERLARLYSDALGDFA